MDQDLAELLSDAFSGSSFPDRDLESFKLDESGDLGEAKEADSALYQEVINDTGNVCGEDAAQTNKQVYVKNNEEVKEVRAVRMHETPGDVNLGVGEEDEGKGTGHFLPVHNDISSHKNEFGEGQALPPGAVHNLQDEDIRHNEVSNFVSLLKGDATKDNMQKKEEKTQGESFDMSVAVEANVGFMEDLIAEVHTLVEKVKDFSGEEHQEAGESYADYPSDFPPCEYGENEAHAPEEHHQWNIYDITSSVQHLERPAWTRRGEGTKMLESNISQLPANDANMVAKCEDKTSSDQISLDDGFVTLEALSIPETGSVLDDDREEEERSWEEEQKRIDAFFRFYDDSDGELEREGRGKKVQFCTKPMSEILHYDSYESFSSSDEEQGLRMAEAPEEWTERQESLDTERDFYFSGASEHDINVCNTQLCNRRHVFSKLLNLTVKMGLVTLIGLLMFWLAAYQMDWLALFYFC